MHSKIIFLFLVFVLFLPVVTSYTTSNPEEAALWAAKANCIIHPKEECNKVVEVGEKKFSCEYSEEFNRCDVNKEQEKAIIEAVEQERFFNAISYMAFTLLIFLSVFLLFYKFGKSDILKKIYGVKLIGLILIILIMLLKLNRFPILLALYIAPLLSLFAMWKSGKEQKKLKIAIVVIFLVEFMAFSASLSGFIIN